jgi:hypothetical protein
VAAQLERAYAWIDAGADRVANYLRAANAVAPCLARRMALPQRLRVLYVEACAYAADDQPDEALEWTDGAIELAIELDDQSAVSALLYLHGALNTRLLRYAEAAADYDDSRLLVRVGAQSAGPRNAPTELRLTTLQANLRFFMGQYAAAEHLIEEARALVPLCPNERRERATIAWVEANLFRWRGAPELGLRQALAAAEFYTESGPANSAARIQVVASDIALDLAATFPTGSDRDAMLRLAQPHIAQALQLAEGVGDEAGTVLARLAEVRCLRLSGFDVDRLGTIERLAEVARRRGDVALLGQAFTALGDELAARRELEAAHTQYWEALEILDGSDVRALGVWAWRALHRPDGTLSPGA